MGKTKQVGRYSTAKRQSVATEWAASGNVSHVARITGVSRPTIRSWRDEGSDEWDAWVATARHQIGEEILSTQLTNARLAGEQLSDRIVNGDTKVMANGSTVTVPMNGKDLAVVNGIQVDKARTAMNMPNVVTSTSSSMESLAARFAQIERDHHNITDSTILTVKGPIKKG